MTLKDQIKEALKSGDSDDSISDIEDIIESHVMTSEDILEWFNSPFVTDFDKKQVKLKIKGLWKK